MCLCEPKHEVIGLNAFCSFNGNKKGKQICTCDNIQKCLPVIITTRTSCSVAQLRKKSFYILFICFLFCFFFFCFCFSFLFLFVVVFFVWVALMVRAAVSEPKTRELGGSIPVWPSDLLVDPAFTDSEKSD